MTITSTATVSPMPIIIERGTLVRLDDLISATHLDDKDGFVLSFELRPSVQRHQGEHGQYR